MNEVLKKIIPSPFNGLRNQKKIQQEPEELIENRKQFYSQFAGKNDLVFDIGANYGNRVEPILRNGCKVVAVEPQPECVSYLRKKYDSRINIENVGIGSKRDTGDLHISSWNILSTFSVEFIEKTKETGRFKNSEWSKTIKVKIITLDDLITKYGIPKFIKVDVEGYEDEVFKGLTHRVPFLSFEYTLPEFSGAMLSILEHLKKSGNININYSTGESMQLNLLSWLDYDTFCGSFSKDKKFRYSMQDFGDIYVSFIL